MRTESAWQRFGHWRRRRPFWGGLLLLLSALALFFSSNLTIADLQVHFGQEGYLSYLLPAIQLLCGLLVWFTPAQRLFYAVIALVTALYSLIGLNLGGFGAGMVLGIIGGALAIAWTPGTAPAPLTAEPPTAEPRTAEPRTAESVEQPAGPESAPFDRPGDGGAPTAILPGFDDPDGEPGPPPPAGGAHRKFFALLLVPLMVTAGVLAAGSHTPAHAGDDCPDGLPSRSAGRSEGQATKSSAAARPSTPAEPPAKPPAKPPAEPPTKPQPLPTPAGSAEPQEPAGGPDEDTGNPIVDGWNDLVEGIGDLFGHGDDQTPAPAPPESGTPTAGPSGKPSKKPTPSRPAAAPGRAPGRSPTATPSLPDVPCLGPRVVKEAGPEDLPPISARHGVMEGDSLVMYDSTYDGVVEVPTAEGPVRVLKFSMRKSVTKPFSLTIPEAGGHTTLIRSNALTVEGNVRFYTPKFTGKLFGLIPVTFTPDQPPPLTLPVLQFSDIRIDLAFVRSDVLTADPLDLRELR